MKKCLFALLLGVMITLSALPLWGQGGNFPPASSGSGTPCTTTALSIQYNAAGSFGCEPDFTFTAPHTLTLGASGIFTINAGATVTGLPAASILAGALANGMTCTTQTAGDNTADCATNAFVNTAVNNAIAGVNPAVAVLAASTANLTGTYAQVGGGVGDTFTVTATGAFTLDGIAINTIGQRVLLKNQTTASQNGIYTATVVGITAVSPVFTRALDYDMPSDVNNTGSIPVQSGTVNNTTSWLLTSQVTSIGSAGSSLTYAQFSINPSSTVQTVSCDGTTVTCSGTTAISIASVAAPAISAANMTSVPACSTCLTTTNTSSWMTTSSSFSLTTTNYFPVTGIGESAATTEPKSQTIVGRNVTVTGMQVNLATAFTGTSVVFTLQQCTPSSGACTGATVTGVTCTITSGNTCSVSGLTAAVTGGNFVDIKSVVTGTADTTITSITTTYY